MDFTKEIKGHVLEYYDNTHTYLVDGKIVPSITTLLKTKFGHKYDYVKKETLERARDKGIEVHDAIERYCKTGDESDLKELRNFKFLQRQYKFEVIDNEIPVILFKDDEPISAGRLDMVILMDDELGLADIKRTSGLDKEYLAYQLNLYRIAYQQSYDIGTSILKGIHLRDDVRKFVNIPINERIAWQFISEYMEGQI